MARKGSITAFLSLLLGILLVLVSVCYTSVRMASSRTQILCGADIGLYSLFGQYDREIFDHYGLLLLDSGGSGGLLDPGAVYQSFRHYMDPVLKENHQSLNVEGGGFTGYRLITDFGGEPFFRQAVREEKENPLDPGVPSLEQLESWKNEFRAASDTAESLNGEEILNACEREIQAARERSRALEEQELLTAGPDLTEVKLPVSLFRSWLQAGPEAQVGISVSDLVSQPRIGTVLSRRSLQQGMGMYDSFCVSDSPGEEMLFQGYLGDRFGDFLNPSSCGIRNELEYMIFGKDSDQEDMEEMLRRLLKLRLGADYRYLEGNEEGQIRALALEICSYYPEPPSLEILEKAIRYCWAYAESTLEVRQLLNGGRNTFPVQGSGWLLPLSQLPSFAQLLVSASGGEGMNYDDYLQTFLFMVSKEDKVMRAMDCLEQEQRSGGRSGFMLDSCITAAEISVDVHANGRKEFHLVRAYSYE